MSGRLNILVGLPSDPVVLDGMHDRFFSLPGRHIVCGGTTAMLAAAYLGERLIPDMDFPDPDIPAIGILEGVDLVTEGVVTLGLVAELLEGYDGTNPQWQGRADGAARLADELISADEVHFVIGLSRNTSHESTGYGIGLDAKLDRINRIAGSLTRLGRTVSEEKW